MSPSDSQTPSRYARCRDRPVAQGFVARMHIDGACRGNPGPGGIGVVISSDDLVLREISEAIGRCTNNEAEYTALIRGLDAALEMGVKRVRTFSDSQLVVRQINGGYKAKRPQMQGLVRQASALIDRLESFELRHTSREGNREANQLASRALQGQKGRRTA